MGSGKGASKRINNITLEDNHEELIAPDKLGDFLKILKDKSLEVNSELVMDYTLDWVPDEIVSDYYLGEEVTEKDNLSNILSYIATELGRDFIKNKAFRFVDTDDDGTIELNKEAKDFIGSIDVLNLNIMVKQVSADHGRESFIIKYYYKDNEIVSTANVYTINMTKDKLIEELNSLSLNSYGLIYTIGEALSIRLENN